MRTLLATFIVASALGACSKNEPPPPATTPEPSAMPAATTAPSAAMPEPSASAAIAEPPTEEDFEDEASDKVTVKTLDAQLDALEKEIQAD
jgi:hypothetical protein